MRLPAAALAASAFRPRLTCRGTYAFRDTRSELLDSERVARGRRGGRHFVAATRFDRGCGGQVGVAAAGRRLNRGLVFLELCDGEPRVAAAVVRREGLRRGLRGTCELLRR